MNFRRIIIVALTFILAACGGGGEDGEDGYVLDFSSYDDYSRPTETYTPPSNQNSFFPLALHFRTITKSYANKVGTTSVRNYSISGTMTTPTVNSGTYSAKQTITTRYESSALFEGIAVIPATSDFRRYDIKLNDVSQPETNSSSTAYYDTTYGIKLGSTGSGTYYVLDANQSTLLPEVALAGETGNFLVYQVYSDSTKSNRIGTQALGYKILTTSIGSSGEYLARIEYITRSYSSTGQLLSVATSTEDVVYSLKSGAGARTVSFYVDDVSGSTTSRLLYTRTN